jgi:hypothetical protein
MPWFPKDPIAGAAAIPQPLSKFFRSHQGIWGKGRRSQYGPCLGSQRAINVPVHGSEACGRMRMGMNDGLHIGSCFVNRKVHGDFNTGFQLRGKIFAMEGKYADLFSPMCSLSVPEG